MSSSTSEALGARLDRMPITRFHHELALIVGLGLLVDTIDIYATATVSGALVTQGFASLNEVAVIAAVTSLGLGVGALVTGLLGDQYGRRRILQWTLLIVVIGSIGASFASSVPQLVAWRLITAIGLGGESVLAYGILLEFLPSRVRGHWLARLAFITTLALPLTLLAAYFILPANDGWRWMLGAPGIAGVGVFFLRMRLKESPRWLAARGRTNEADVIVTAIEATARTPLQTLPVPPTISAPLPLASVRLLSPQILRAIAVAVAVNVALMSATFGFVTWLPTFFASAGRDLPSSIAFAGIMTAGAPVGTLIGMLLSDRVERKWALVWASLAAVALGCAYAWATTPATILALGFLVVTSIYVLAAFGFVAYVPELFPTPVRMRGVGIALTSGRITAMGLPLLIAPLFAATGQSGVVLAIAATIAIQALIVALLGSRTKGRAIDSI